MLSKGRILSAINFNLNPNMEPETTTPNTCGSCNHEHEASNACTAEGCNCGADTTAAPAADATGAPEAPKTE